MDDDPLTVSSPSRVIAPPVVHTFPSVLFFNSSLKFSLNWRRWKHYSFPQCTAKNGSQLQKLEGTKVFTNTWSPWSPKLEGRVPRVPSGSCACEQALSLLGVTLLSNGGSHSGVSQTEHHYERLAGWCSPRSVNQRRLSLKTFSHSLARRALCLKCKLLQKAVNECL